MPLGTLGPDVVRISALSRARAAGYPVRHEPAHPETAPVKSITRLFGQTRRRIAGVVAASSMDAMEAAVVEMERHPKNRAGPLTWELLDFLRVPYPDAVRAEIEAVTADGERVLERLTRLHFILGHLAADAVETLAADAGTPLASLDVVALQGQTVCHFPHFPVSALTRHGSGAASWGRAARGREGWVSASTLALGEPAVLAGRLGRPVISDFRSRDLAAGGVGGPLAALADRLLFTDPARARLLLHVGGITSMTALRAGARPLDVVATDAGPGTLFLDAVTRALTGGRKHRDEGGALARKGHPASEPVRSALEGSFFGLRPPRTAEGEFGEAYAQGFLELCRHEKLSDAATQATAVRLVAAAARQGYVEFAAPRCPVDEVLVSGQGAHNVVLLEELAHLFEDAKVVTLDYYGLDVDAKEAAAVAVLAQASLDGEEATPSEVTGASCPVVSGHLTPGERPGP